MSIIFRAITRWFWICRELLGKICCPIKTGHGSVEFQTAGCGTNEGEIYVKDLLKNSSITGSLYTFSLASLLEIMLSGNFKEEYITELREIESLSMTYRDLYGKCSEYLERLGNSALEANLLKESEAPAMPWAD